MNSLPSFEHLLKRITAGQWPLLSRELKGLPPAEQDILANKLIQLMAADPKSGEILVPVMGDLLLGTSPEKRFPHLVRLIAILQETGLPSEKELGNLLESTLLKLLQPLELITLATILSDYLAGNQPLARETAMWGIVKIIPFLHPINQKEFVFDIYQHILERQMGTKAIECLTSLLFNLDHHCRLDLTRFFLDMLKKDGQGNARPVLIELLKRITSALPENERVIIADNIAPLIYFSDTRVVSASINYFACNISLLPAADRFHYTQLVAGMIHDQSVRQETIEAIEKAIPFLSPEYERKQFQTLLEQFERPTETLEGDSPLMTACLGVQS